MPSAEDWTRVTWWELHTLASYFPDDATDERKRNFVRLLEAFADNLPCAICGVHMKEYMQKHPVLPATESSDKLQTWMYEFHESVNKRRGKPQMHTVDQVKEAFRSTMPWKEFGGYPILPTQGLITSKPSAVGANVVAPGSMTVATSNNNANDIWVWILVISILAILLLVSVIVVFTLWRQYTRVRKLANPAANNNSNANRQNSRVGFRSQQNRRRAVFIHP